MYNTNMQDKILQRWNNHFRIVKTHTWETLLENVETAHIKSPTIPLSSFEENLKAVNNPEDPFFQVDEDIVHFNERFVRDEFQVMFHELDSEVSLEENNKGI